MISVFVESSVLLEGWEWIEKKNYLSCIVGMVEQFSDEFKLLINSCILSVQFRFLYWIEDGKAGNSIFYEGKIQIMICKHVLVLKGGYFMF